jgi:hypothetical protein
MPEEAKSFAMWKQIDEFLRVQDLSSSSTSTVIHNLTIHITTAEASGFPAGSPPYHGYIHVMSSSYTYQHGICNSQTLIYPPKYATLVGEDPVPILQH